MDWLLELSNTYRILTVWWKMNGLYLFRFSNDLLVWITREEPNPILLPKVHRQLFRLLHVSMSVPLIMSDDNHSRCKFSYSWEMHSFRVFTWEDFFLSFNWKDHHKDYKSFFFFLPIILLSVPAILNENRKKWVWRLLIFICCIPLWSEWIPPLSNEKKNSLSRQSTDRKAEKNENRDDSTGFQKHQISLRSYRRNDGI